MGEFLANMIKALEFVLKETPPQDMFGILAERIKYMFESSIIERDVDNFIAYFRVLISSKHSPKILRFDRKLVQAFTERTDTGRGNAATDFRTEKLYAYLCGKIEDGTEITKEHLDRVYEESEILKMPSLEKVMENIRIAMILKWVQGPLMQRLSHAMQDYIVVLATVYGECKKNLTSNVEWPPLSLSEKDKNTLEDEYRIFEIAMMEALQAFRSAHADEPDQDNVEEQFQIVFSSLQQLAKMDAAGTLHSVDSFKDRIIVSSALVYIQDDYVVKNDKLRQLIRLFVSMYIKYRDKRYSSTTE
ncbi:MAG: hypothetical protein WBE28_01480 [bacterium]